MPFFKSDYAKETDKAGRFKAHGTRLLSAGYKATLGYLVDEETRVAYNLERGATWADFIALQTVRRAVGLVSKEAICFTAITEIRESTEGKTPERVIASGNEELLALAKAINGDPAPEPEERALP